MAELDKVERVYRMGSQEVYALNGVSFCIERGQYWSVMGASGSGKSTLLNLLGCLDRPTAGTYCLAGRDVNTLDDDELSDTRSRKLGFIFQSYNLIPQLNVLENIMVPLFYQDDWGDADLERAHMLAGRMGLTDRLDHRPTELSGGQQQRVAAARALVSQPDIIFADEPSGNLDSKSAAELLDFMRNAVKEFGQTIVMVTHDPVAASYADRIVFLEDGRIAGEMHDPTPETVIDRMKQYGT